MGIKILTPGIHTTVQDLGRFGSRGFGFSPAGAMDADACRLANILAGNEETEAVLEITQLGPAVEFGEDEVIAVTGAYTELTVNGASAPMYKAFRVNKGDVLRFGYPKEGRYIYLAFAGGLDIPAQLGSYSTHVPTAVGGFNGKPLEAGALIRLKNPRKRLRRMGKREVISGEGVGGEEKRKSGSVPLRILFGPQEDCFTEKGIRTLTEGDYRLLEPEGRREYRLEGAVIEHKPGVDVLPGAVNFGTIQITPEGLPVVAMADHEAVGGLARIASVISADFSRLAQLETGGRVHFVPCSVETAQQLYRMGREVVAF